MSIMYMHNADSDIVQYLRDIDKLKATDKHSCNNVSRCLKSLSTTTLRAWSIAPDTTQVKAQYTPPTPMRLCCGVESCRRRLCETKFATSSRRLPTDSVDNLETEHSGLITWILIYIHNVFNNDVVVSSLVTNINSSTAQEIVNLVTTADGCAHTADATQLDSWVASA